jgi:hypothetical protein
MLTASAASSIPITRAITLGVGTPITREIGPSASRFKHTGAPRKQRGVLLLDRQNPCVN